MQALVFHKFRDVRVERVGDPVIEDPRDAIIRVTATAICGSDLHIYNFQFPQLANMIARQFLEKPVPDTEGNLYQPNPVKEGISGHWLQNENMKN